MLKENQWRFLFVLAIGLSLILNITLLSIWQSSETNTQIVKDKCITILVDNNIIEPVKYVSNEIVFDLNKKVV